MVSLLHADNISFWESKNQLRESFYKMQSAKDYLQIFIFLMRIAPNELQLIICDNNSIETYNNLNNGTMKVVPFFIELILTCRHVS